MMDEQELIDTFMTRFKAPRNQQRQLSSLQTFLQERKVGMVKATYSDLLAFLQTVDGRNVLIDTKEAYRRVCFQFYRFLKVRMKLREDNPVPEVEEYKFTEKDRTGEKPKIPLDEVSARRILEYLHHADLMLYVGVCILFYTGMRILELVNIEKKNLDLEKRMIVSRGKTGFARYFIPRDFKPDFITFYNYQEQINPDNPYLFPNMLRTRSKHMNATTKFFRSNLALVKEKLGIACSTHPHAWRDLINSSRADKFKLARDRDSLLSILLCQRPIGVNAQHYLKKYDWKNPSTWEAHRDLYDELYPW